MPTAVALLLLAVSPGAEPDAKQVEYFETKIRPVLVEHCYSCHSAGAKKLKGGLLLDTRAWVLKGGDTGPAGVPGKPAEGTLIPSIRYAGDIHMPPNGKLPDQVVKDFEAWIAGGAADPRTDAAAKASAIDIEKGKQFWSFQPVREPAVPDISDFKFQVSNPVDAFVVVGWKEKQLTPAPPADKRTLLRRVYLDLIGVPPTIENVEAAEKDTSPEAVAG
ncbi:MAG: DUF1549 domain-containing protein, partial [Gemmataceae bacterium]